MYTIFAFFIIIIASLATGIGGLTVFFSKNNSKKFLAASLSFSAGVMLYISFAEIFLESIEALEDSLDYGYGLLVAAAAFFAGIIIMAIIDKCVSHNDNATLLKENSLQDDKSFQPAQQKELKHTGVMAAIALALHNLPEGFITFVALIVDPVLGIGIAIAIIIHNIPEGIATATPIYYVTGSRFKAFLIALGTGFFQVIGAVIAFVLMRYVIPESELLFGIAFAVVAGIMVFVAIHQLLPTAQKYGKHHTVMKWLFAGMAVMAVSLVGLEFVF